MGYRQFLPRQVNAYRNWGSLAKERYEWSEVVGGRVRKLREERGWFLWQLAERVVRPDGARYSIATFSRLERGAAGSPFYVYLQLARALDIAPGRLLGEDSAVLPAGESELTLLRTLRIMGVSPPEALALILGARTPDPGVAPGGAGR
jgi:transcriptional regulator with XRE-family HTH domain